MLSSSQRPVEFVKLQFSEISQWSQEDHLAAFNCFKLSARRMVEKPYSTKVLGISAPDLVKIAHKAMDQPISDGQSARKFFEHHFEPHKFSAKPFEGMLTGYFEPELQASRKRTARFKFPLYRRPDDLIDLNDKNRPDNMSKDFAFGRKTKSGVMEYLDRGQIQQGALDGFGLELFWLENPVDVFFTHIQGSAHLSLTDGTSARVSYAAKSGHPYTAIGKILVERGELQLEQVTMGTIRQWLDENPNKRKELFAQNRSHIFFQVTEQPKPELGPVAAAGVPLTAGRSLAVDRHLHTFGTPIWTHTNTAFKSQSQPFARLLIAQDTGSAIIGQQRGDLFVGSGIEAGIIAGDIKHAASFTVFIPKPDQG